MDTVAPIWLWIFFVACVLCALFVDFVERTMYIDCTQWEPEARRPAKHLLTSGSEIAEHEVSYEATCATPQFKGHESRSKSCCLSKIYDVTLLERWYRPPQ